MKKDINKHIPKERMYCEVINHYKELYNVDYDIIGKGLETFGDGSDLHKFLEFAKYKKNKEFNEIYKEYNALENT